MAVEPGRFGNSGPCRGVETTCPGFGLKIGTSRPGTRGLCAGPGDGEAWGDRGAPGTAGRCGSTGAAAGGAATGEPECGAETAAGGDGCPA
jgi:hypothetical protein